MGFIRYTVALVIISLFAIAITTFAINFSSDNDASISISDDNSFSNTSDELNSDIEVFYEGVNTSNSAFIKSTISSQTEASEGGTQFKVTPSTSMSMAKKSITTAWEKVFGSDSGFGIVFTALISLIGFIVGLYAYKAWVGRNPD